MSKTSRALDHRGPVWGQVAELIDLWKDGGSCSSTDLATDILEVVRRVLANQGQDGPEQLVCCFRGCDEVAEWALTPCDGTSRQRAGHYTHVCDEHVGKLLSCGRGIDWSVSPLGGRDEG